MWKLNELEEVLLFVFCLQIIPTFFKPTFAVKLPHKNWFSIYAQIFFLGFVFPLFFFTKWRIKILLFFFSIQRYIKDWIDGNLGHSFVESENKKIQSFYILYTWYWNTEQYGTSKLGGRMSYGNDSEQKSKLLLEKSVWSYCISIIFSTAEMSQK